MSKITFEKLAIMIEKGFKEVHQKIDTLKLELKTDIKDIRFDIKDMRNDISELDRKQSRYVHRYEFNKQDARITRLENQIFPER